MLRPDLAQALGHDRFLREIAVAATLAHPHILPLFDSDIADGMLFYTMPYVEGETLRHRLQREGRLPVADAVEIARDVADALAYAHAQNIVHRDIKPENILIEAGHPVVSDFGIARAISAANEARVTGTGIVVGTVDYMSPEQAAGDELDGRSDIYSLSHAGEAESRAVGRAARHSDRRRIRDRSGARAAARRALRDGGRFCGRVGAGTNRFVPAPDPAHPTSLAGRRDGNGRRAGDGGRGGITQAQG